jgi:hypothetical protein
MADYKLSGVVCVRRMLSETKHWLQKRRIERIETATCRNELTQFGSILSPNCRFWQAKLGEISGNFLTQGRGGWEKKTVRE